MNRKHKASCLITAILVAWLSIGAFATAQVPSVGGTIFHDLNNNGLTDVGEGLGGVSLTLYADDGDMLFDINTDMVAGTMSTSATGQYGFNGLDTSKNYFVYQGAQSLGSLQLLNSSVSGLLDPLVETMMVDAFESQQRVEGNPIVAQGMLNLASASASVIGGERDLRVDHISGSAESVLHANPWGLVSVLEFDQTAGTSSVATITWDGPDNDMSTTPMSNGLGGMDLTEHGGAAFAFMAGIDEAGAGDVLTLRIFSGDEVSTVTVPMPVTDGTATSYMMVPFSSFLGAASFELVDAIQAELGGNNKSIDAQLGPINIVGGNTANFSVVATPEPSTGLMAAISLLFLISTKRKRRHLA